MSGRLFLTIFPPEETANSCSTRLGSEEGARNWAWQTINIESSWHKVWPTPKRFILHKSKVIDISIQIYVIYLNLQLIYDKGIFHFRGASKLPVNHNSWTGESTAHIPITVRSCNPWVREPPSCRQMECDRCDALRATTLRPGVKQCLKLVPNGWARRNIDCD